MTLIASLIVKEEIKNGMMADITQSASNMFKESLYLSKKRSLDLSNKTQVSDIQNISMKNIFPMPPKSPISRFGFT